MTLQGGILDPSDRRATADDYYTYYRTPTPANSRGSRLTRRVSRTRIRCLAKLYHGRRRLLQPQNWGFDRIVNGWAGTMDANLAARQNVYA